MNVRQKIRAWITLVMLLITTIVIIAVNFNPIYLEVLKQLSLPLMLVLSGYFGTEIVKNINKK